MKSKIFFSIILTVTLCLNVFSQDQNEKYYARWTQVDSLSRKGLPESALGVVESIYKQAKVENNASQCIKAIIFKIQLQSEYQEDYIENTISEMNAEIANSNFPTQSILHSVLAELYWKYYEANRYRFLDRGITTNFNQEDIKTWDLQKITEKTIYHYLQSLQYADRAKKENLELYDEIIVTALNSKKFRPTLYDFLAHRALDFFINEEPSITRPADHFEVDDPAYFSSAEKFTKLVIHTKDTLSLDAYAIKIFQELIAFHLTDNDPQALIDVELKRLNYVNQQSTIDKRDSLYSNALQQLRNKYFSFSSSTYIDYELAELYSNSAQQYNPLFSDMHKWDLKEAHQYCKSAIQRFPESDGAKNCNILKENIEEASVYFTTSYANPSNNPFLGLVSYKNTNEIYCRIIKMNPTTDHSLRSEIYGEELVSMYRKMPIVKEWSVKLLDDGDFQMHSTEIKIPELPTGYYIMLVGTDQTMSYKNDQVAFSSIWVSDISYISRRNEKGAYEIFVADREKGNPLPGVNVKTYCREYNYSSRKYEDKLWQTYTTDKTGYFQIPALAKGSSSRDFFMMFINKRDTLITEDYFYQYAYYKQQESKTKRTFFFCDRAIYRPGQTIYFKGILLEESDNKNQIVPNAMTFVTFYDVNGEKVSSLVLKTNEYGSFSGSFVAPTGVLTGEMYIANESGNIYISVEEYKRPNFEVAINPIKGSYKLDEQINVTGTAKAYSGSKVSGGKVSYRVVRSTFFPYKIFGWSWFFPTKPEIEISNGETITNDTGYFSFNFKAIADRLIPKEDDPFFTYQVHVDVTDINGETRSSTKDISVGYTALFIETDLPETLNKDNNPSITFSTTNLSGEKEPANLLITINRLKEPTRILKTRLWDKPDRFVMTKEEFYSSFPNDIYNDEDNPEKWEIDNPILQSQLNTLTDSVLLLNSSVWEQGHYVLIAKTKDKYGQDVNVKRYFTVFSPSAKQIPDYSLDWISELKSQGEPGENALLLFGSKDNDVNVLYEIEQNNTIVKREWLKISDQQKNLNIPITEECRGNFIVHLAFVKHNRSFYHKQTIVVPYTNKQLDITFETFRNKLLPGQEEEWKIKISNKKGDKVAAELLAAMYDASLDIFKKNEWYFDIYSSYYGSLWWDVLNSFSTKMSQTVSKSTRSNTALIYKNYDQLNWFGLNYYGGYYSRGPRPPMYSKGGDLKMAVMPMSAMVSEEGAPGKKDEKEATADDAAVQTKKKEVSQDVQQPVIRKDFSETAFFFPQLETNIDGEIIISFKVPEALTRWNILGLAYTKDLSIGTFTRDLVTQKDLMLTPNTPRFFREGDKMTFSVKLANISTNDLAGMAELNFFDAYTMKPIDSLMKNKIQKNFTITKGQNIVLGWDIEIPANIDAITYRVVAKTDRYSDGEEAILPVLSNRMLVTETMPLPIKGKETKTFTFNKLVDSQKSSTLTNYKLTLEFTSNPAWYAIQALPYMMDYPYESADRIFENYYANSIASFIINSSPKIKQVFQSWQNATPDALLSNLEKNESLKSVILEETPWVLDAKNESERKQRVALLFDLNQMKNKLRSTFRKLQKLQTPNGGWAWFSGMPDDRYITQYIVTGLGHLNHLSIMDIKKDNNTFNMLQDALLYLDDRMREDYNYLKKYYPNEMDKCHLSAIQIQYFYARSYFKNDVPIVPKNQEAFDYYFAQMKTHWLAQGKYMQAMSALALNRYNENKVAKEILASLKEKALHSEEMGMYWRDLNNGFYWYEASIESQALMIEAFDEVTGDEGAVKELKIWLLKQKQTQSWKTSRATAEACYALLLRGTDLLLSDKLVDITIGNKKIDPRQMDNTKVEAGTGYFSTSWLGGDITPEMGTVVVTKQDEGIAWGAMYWQYFEQLDKITPSATPLKLNKKLFVERNTPQGPVLDPIKENGTLKVGDKVIVRVELRVDRNMEYVHMKDMRAAAFEPTNVISSYNYRDGLGYYEATKDAATNFFFSYLPKGTYVFEYSLIASQKGDFSNGITTIQCLYAPEFSSHSEGIRVKVQ